MIDAILQTVNTLVVVIGVPAICIGLISVGKKFQLLDTINKLLNEEIRPDLKEVREKFFNLEGKLSGIFQSASPISLTEKGNSILNNSAIKKYVDDNIDDLLKQCLSNGESIETAYDIQEKSFELFENINFPDDIKKELRQFSFTEGISVDIIKRVGGIYFRDRCLERQGMKKSDLDEK